MNLVSTGIGILVVANVDELMGTLGTQDGDERCVSTISIAGLLDTLGIEHGVVIVEVAVF